MLTAAKTSAGEQRSAQPRQSFQKTWQDKVLFKQLEYVLKNYD